MTSEDISSLIPGAYRSRGVSYALPKRIQKENEWHRSRSPDEHLALIKRLYPWFARESIVQAASGRSFAMRQKSMQVCFSDRLR